MRIAIIGFGTVGQALAQVLLSHAERLAAEQQVHPQVVAIATRSRGALVDAGGLNLQHALNAISRGHLNYYPTGAALTREVDALHIARQVDADVLVEVSPTNLETGQPALDVCYAALDSGKHVVLANKGPVAVAYRELMARAAAAQRRVLFEATVMAGTPSIRLAREALSGAGIRELRGILNGTTNWMLTQMADGMTYADALSRAQALGYAEADPTADVDGWDAAGKALILAAAVFGVELRLSDVQVSGIRALSAEDVQRAAETGERYKLIARLTPEGGSVRAERLPLTDPLAGVSGVTNAVTYTTDLLGPVTLIGAGAGGQATAFGVLSDLLALHRDTR